MSPSLMNRSRDLEWNNLSTETGTTACGASENMDDGGLPLNVLSLEDDASDTGGKLKVNFEESQAVGNTGNVDSHGIWTESGKKLKAFGSGSESDQESQARSICPAGTMVGSAEMEEWLGSLKIQILEEHRELLCRRLIPERFFPFLRSVFFLTLEDCEHIKSHVTTSEKVDEFLDILIKKGPLAFDHLCTAILKLNDNGWIITVLRTLNKAFEKRRQDILGVPSLTDEATPEEDLPVPGKPGGPEVPQ